MVADKWLKELPQQFQEKKKIEVLIRAFGRQLDELYEVFEDLRTKTTLENAVGQNLDYCGDIMATTRKDAQTILMTASNAEITDDVYRKVLTYKALRNNCDCTYYDIMDSLNMLWNTDNVRYVEDPEKPATIYIALPEVSLDGMDPAIGRVLALRPGGVDMVYTTGYAEVINISGKEQVEVSATTLRYWRLNGKYLLDGSKLLGPEIIEEVW